MKIREYRKLHGLSQSDIAKALGIVKNNVSHWERGSQLPSLAMAYRVKMFTRGEVDLEDWFSEA
jgi:transcriptional regulator with XRE-family HTH domain